MGHPWAGPGWTCSGVWGGGCADGGAEHWAVLLLWLHAGATSGDEWHKPSLGVTGVSSFPSPAPCSSARHHTGTKPVLCFRELLWMKPQMNSGEHQTHPVWKTSSQTGTSAPQCVLWLMERGPVEPLVPPGSPCPILTAQGGARCHPRHRRPHRRVSRAVPLFPLSPWPGLRGLPGSH